jgi:curved DNA-binding protein CbpA
MTRFPDHYAVLGVGRRATSEDLRLAYFRCIKECHPDRQGLHGPIDQASAMHVRAVNEAYSVLKNAHKREMYDLSLAYPAASPAGLQHGHSPKAKPGRPKRQLVAVMLALLLLLSLTLLLAQSAVTDTAGGNLIQGLIFGRSMSSDRFAASQVALSSRMRKAIRDATGASASEAVASSSSCFRDARVHPELERIDSCVAFDAAYSYWHQGERALLADSHYFSDTQVETRALDALGGLGPEYAPMRLESLRNVTFSVILSRAVELADAENRKAQGLEGRVIDPTEAERAQGEAGARLPAQGEQDRPIMGRNGTTN